MNSIARESLLYDLYGRLLTDKKRTVMECYHEDDMSLGEIAEDMGISRAAVYDSLKSAEALLEQYEEKLGLLARYEKASMLAEEADGIISGLGIKTSTAGSDSSAAGDDSDKTERLREIISELAEPGV